MIADDRHEAGLIIVWEFCVEPDKQREFEDAYGAEGLWAQFFRRGEGYIKTELHADPRLPGRYLTLDFWVSSDAFEKFKHVLAEDYRAIDEHCELLTAEEKFLGYCKNLHELQGLLLAHGSESPNDASESQIHPATQADIPAMLAIEQTQHAAAHWSRKSYDELFNPDAPLRVALIAKSGDGALLGFAIARLTGDDCELENMAVLSNEQRRGIGRTLLCELINGARLRGAVCMHLEVRESNARARALYETCGFTVSGRRTDYYRGPSENALIYQLQFE